jgi:hypothetical protein
MSRRRPSFTLGWDEPASDVVPNNRTTAAFAIGWDD